MNWRTLPMVRPCMAFIIGIYLSSYCLEIDYWSFIGILLFVNTALILSIRSFKSKSVTSVVGFMLIGVFVIFGFVRSEIDKPQNQGLHYDHVVGDSTVRFKATVLDFKSGLKWHKYFARVDSIVVGEKMVASLGKILLNQKAFENHVIEVGNQLLVTTKVIRLRKNTNPYMFNYGGYLQSKGIHLQVYLDSCGYSIVDEYNVGLISSLALRIKKKGLAIFSNKIKNEEAKSVAAAMVFGERNDLSIDLKETFIESGAVHILAVSGLHVGVFYALILWLLGFCKVKNKLLRFILTSGMLMFYALIVGGSPSVVRAAFMFTIFAIGKNWFESVKSLNVLAFCAISLLFYDPKLLFDLGFILSFLAIWSIIYFIPLLQGLWMPSNKYFIFIWNCVLVTVAAQILVLPYMLYTFHALPIYSILSGILVVPLAEIILYFGLGALALSVFFGNLGDVVFNLFEGVLNLVIWLVRTIQGLPYSVMQGIYLDSSQVVLIYLSIFIFMYFIHLRKVRVYYISMVVFLSCVVLTSFRYHKSNVQLKMILYEAQNDIHFDIFDGQIGLSYYGLDTLNGQYSGHMECQLANCISQNLNIKDSVQTSRVLTRAPYLYVESLQGIIIEDNVSIDNVPKMDFVIFNTKYIKGLETIKFKEGAILVFSSRVGEKLKIRLKDKTNNCKIIDIRETGFQIIDFKKPKL